MSVQQQPEIARYGGKVTAYVDEKIADMVIEREQ